MSNPRAVLLEKAIAYFVARGVGDTSLRALAAGIGTSHRMLIYHFGSREGLLAAIVTHLDQSQQAVLEKLSAATPDDPRESAWQFWCALVEDLETTPLEFELSAAAMQGAPWAESFREGAARWVQRSSEGLIRMGVPREQAEVLAPMGIAVVRGALWELAITGDRDGADRTVRSFLDAIWPSG